MKALRYLLIKEYKQMFRNWILPAVYVIVPIMMMNVIPRIATQEIKNLSIVIIDNDQSTLSRRLTEKVSSSAYFNLLCMNDTYRDAYEHIKQGDADIILTIAQDFERNLYRTGTAEVMIDTNAVNGMKGNMGAGYLSQIIQTYANELNKEYGMQMKTPLTVSPRFLFNHSLDYKTYMIPAFMIMSLVLLVGFLPAMNIVSEKEKGTIEQINVTPVGRFEFVLSKMIPYWTVGVFIILISIIMAWQLHGILPTGSIGLILLFTLMGSLTISSLGLIVSNYSDSIRQAAMVMFFFIIIFLLTSGLLSPIASMPDWAKELTRINPMRYLMQAMREIYLKGSGFTELLPQFIPLCLYGFGASVWAIISYQKKE